MISMMKKMSKLALVGVFATSLANADMHEEEQGGGMYVSGSLGMAANADTMFETPGTKGTVDLTGESLVGDVALGYAFANGIRIEGEIAWIPLEIGDLTYTKFDGAPVDLVNQVAQIAGDASAQSFTVSLFFDFEAGEWKPYLGVGFGVTNVDLFVKGDIVGEDVFFDDDDNVRSINSSIGVKRALGKSGKTFVDLNLTHTQLDNTQFMTNGIELDGDDFDLATFRIGIQRNIGKRRR